jgi:hypothetical protein
MRTEGRWLPRLHFKEQGHERELMEMWRLALSAYLWVALQKRALVSNLDTELLKKILKTHYQQKWIIYVSPVMSKAKFLRYAGRYIRRPPIPLSHILGTTDHGVQFLAKDTREKRMVQLVWPKEMFVDTLGEHFPDHYRHAMRYFGLLAPRRKNHTSAIVFSLLRQKKRPRPARLRWAESIGRDFGVDPLIDRHGKRMNWSGRLTPWPSVNA